MQVGVLPGSQGFISKYFFTAEWVIPHFAFPQPVISDLAEACSGTKLSMQKTLRKRTKRMANSLFRVTGFGLRVTGFGFRVSGFGFRVTGFIIILSFALRKDKYRFPLNRRLWIIPFCHLQHSAADDAG
ncbi:hypothetical protein D1AOALGA4SA_654 [Olavius algarvensis Delta 1 endosymbiont]|nr:hypothetical protein D1AOALGA4SA_654 [Olavius algarvensis Delta 1 endosymbiont]